jgi:hypothetical protein
MAVIPATATGMRARRVDGDESEDDHRHRVVVLDAVERAHDLHSADLQQEGEQRRAQPQQQ